MCVCVLSLLMLIYTRSIYMEALFCPQKKGWPSPANHQMTTAPTKFTKSRGILGWHRFGRHRFQWHLSSLSISPRFLGKKKRTRVFNRDWWTEFVFFSWSYKVWEIILAALDGMFRSIFCLLKHPSTWKAPWSLITTQKKAKVIFGWWLNQPICKICDRQIGSSPQL